LNLYYFWTFMTKLTLRALTRWQVKGKQNVPKKGPLIVVANHLSMADPPVLSASLPRHIVFMAKEELFGRHLLAPLVRSFGAIRVRKNLADRRALTQARQVLSWGVALGMFPEGSRSPDHRLQPAYPGAALLALNTSAPVLPVAITGTEKIKGMGWLLRPRIEVNIGQPFSLTGNPGRDRRKEIARGTDIIMRHIAELLPPEYRGEHGGDLTQLAFKEADCAD
jgi:1-acyl-sn-glycerol-3-phosphate acyltransferase